MRIAGFVLVGGRSSRMGHDKARLPIHSRSLVEETAATIHPVAQSVTLVGASHRYTDLPFDCIDDFEPGLGPLSGIEAALASRRGDWNIIVACDMPGLETEWLRLLLAEVQQSHAPCVVCRDASGQVHPLCGVWTPAALAAVQTALRERRLRVFDLLQELHAGAITIDHPIHNVNTPAQWAAWHGGR